MCLNMTVCVTGLAEFQLLRRRAASVHARCDAHRADELAACTATAGVDLRGKVTVIFELHLQRNTSVLKLGAMKKKASAGLTHLQRPK